MTMVRSDESEDKSTIQLLYLYLSVSLFGQSLTGLS